MRIADLSRGTAVSAESSGFSCPHYTPLPGSKRCKDYQEGGTCARPDFFLCTEWERRNRNRLPAVSGSTGPAARDDTKVDDFAEGRAAAVPTDLFGNPAPELAMPRHEPRAPATPAPVTEPPRPSDDTEGRPPRRGFTDEDVESFKALGVEVCIRSEDYGEVWLVPEYTGHDRKELTPEHVATISRVLEAFPGSRVVSFEKSPKPNKEADA